MHRSVKQSASIARIVTVILLVVAFVAVAASPAMAQSARKTRAVIRIIKAEGAKAHLSKAEIHAMLKICRRESTFRPTARNHSCKGLFQLKTSSPKWRNPYWNSWKAIRYVKHRYGTWQRALSHSYRYGWY